jgi:hypothetical protein
MDVKLKENQVIRPITVEVTVSTAADLNALKLVFNHLTAGDIQAAVNLERTTCARLMSSSESEVIIGLLENIFELVEQ